MKKLLEEVLGGVTGLVCGCCGLCLLVAGVYDIVSHWEGQLAFTFLSLVLLLLYTVPLLAVAYFCFRREYLKIFLVVGVAGCFAVYGVLMTLPTWSGLFPHVFRQTPENLWHVLFGWLLVFIFFFGPIYAAAWFFRLCHYLAYRGTEGYNPARKTHATGWLVGLGLCVLLGSMLTMLIAFNTMAQSADPAPTPKLIEGWIFWFTNFNLLGAAMMIAGLAWRRPVVERHDQSPATTNDDQLENAGNQ